MTISEKEFQYMTECMARDLAVMLVERHNMTLSEALDVLYNSDTYTGLMRPSTGLYYQSPLYVYDLLETELTKGKLN